MIRTVNSEYDDTMTTLWRHYDNTMMTLWQHYEYTIIYIDAILNISEDILSVLNTVT